jgi:hypothetical protein
MTMTDKEKAERLRDVAETVDMVGGYDQAAEDMRKKADELDPPRLNNIPVGQLCWGWRNDIAHIIPCWEPCVSTGRGSGENLGFHYSKVRLIHPDHWPEGTGPFCVVWKNGLRSFYHDKGCEHFEGVAYFEEKPNATT